MSWKPGDLIKKALGKEEKKEEEIIDQNRMSCPKCYENKNVVKIPKGWHCKDCNSDFSEETPKQQPQQVIQVSQKAEIKDSYDIGKEFEDYIIKLFSPSEFTIIHATPEKAQIEKLKEIGHTIKSKNMPDYILLHKRSNFKFAVECKFRKEEGKDFVFDKDLNSKINFYREFQNSNKIKVFLVIGTGGNSNNPNKIYSIPLSEIKENYNRIWFSKMERFQHPPKEPFRFENAELK